MEQKQKVPVLKLYLGTDEDGVDRLFLDLSIPGREVNLWESCELNSCGEEDFLTALEKVLNETSLWSKSLSLHVKVDARTIVEITEDYSERASKEISNLLHLLRKEN